VVYAQLHLVALLSGQLNAGTATGSLIVVALLFVGPKPHVMLLYRCTAHRAILNLARYSVARARVC
jgi:hypothetical protein